MWTYERIQDRVFRGMAGESVPKVRLSGLHKFGVPISDIRYNIYSSWNGPNSGYHVQGARAMIQKLHLSPRKLTKENKERKYDVDTMP